MKRARSIVGWIVFLVVPPVGGLAAFFLSAKLTSQIPAMAGVALIVTGALAFLLAGRRVGGTAAKRGLAALVAMAIVGGLGWAVFFNRPVVRAVPLAARSIPFERWELSTGSKLASRA